MITIPAIDLKNGKVVRLLQGNFKEEKIYAEEPSEVARHFEEQGARRLHVVDLDGALKGEPKNFRSVEKILGAVKIPVELGGGIRTLKQAQEYLTLGVSWVIFGTKTCLDKGFAKEAIREFGPKALIGIDAMNGLVATDGWTRVTKIKAIELAKEMEALGAQTVIYTDISKDGALKGPNLVEIKNMAAAVRIGVIASGGIGSLSDLQGILKLGQKNITGVIVGKALYENKFTLKEAIAQCSPNA